MSSYAIASNKLCPNSIIVTRVVSDKKDYTNRIPTEKNGLST